MISQLAIKANARINREMQVHGFSKPAALHLYIVGDRFLHFADGETVLTASELVNLLFAYRTKSIKQYYYLHAGQGLTDESDKKIIQSIRQLGLKKYFICANSLFPAKRAAAFLTHKHQAKNTMISVPSKLSENHYESYLMIDENCAEASDHLTGQHIQGAILMEAARQMTLAVTEKFFIDEKIRNQVSFISNRVQTNFYQYVFPLEVKIHYEIKKRRGLVGQNTRFEVIVTFYQNDTAVSEVTYDFTTLNKNYIHDKEKAAAKSVIWRMTQQGGWHEAHGFTIA